MRTLLITLMLFSLALRIMGQGKGENLKINWPEEYKWKIGSNQENETMHMIELIPGSESLEKWTIMGNMMSVKGAKNVPMDVVMKAMYDQAKKNAPKATVTLIEKNESAKNHWSIFKIEAPGFNNDNTPESQLYYIVQGETSLYSNFVAIKEKTLTADFVSKWTKVFKASELVYE